MLFPTYTQFHSTLMLFTIFVALFPFLFLFYYYWHNFFNKIFFSWDLFRNSRFHYQKSLRRKMILFLHITECRKKNFNAIKKNFFHHFQGEKKKEEYEGNLSQFLLRLINSQFKKIFFLSLLFTSIIATYFTLNGNSYVPRDAVKKFLVHSKKLIQNF